MVLLGLFMKALAQVSALALAWSARPAISLTLLSVGMLVALAGVASFRRHKTTVNPLTPEQSSALVTTGIYRFSRNPMYLGFLLVLAAWGVFLANGLSLLGLPACVAYMNHFQIQPEERALGQRFGPAYASYSSRVGRWL